MRSDVSTRSLVPMAIVEAKNLVRRYLGSFPSLNLHDPEIYITELCTVLTGYPLWAGEKAIEQAKDTIRFPATRAELKPLLEDQVRVFRYLDERKQTALPPPADRSNRPTLEELRTKYGPNWGMSPEARQYWKKLATAAVEICGQPYPTSPHGARVRAELEARAERKGRAADLAFEEHLQDIDRQAVEDF